LKTNALISVIVPCYNQAQFLGDALNSIKGQSYPHWECLIVNDGSQDDTESIALSWTQADSRFRYVGKENGGLSSARNAGIKKALGVFILPLDADDKISETYIEECVNRLEQGDGVKLVYGKANFFGTKQGRWALAPYHYQKLQTRNIIHCTAMYRKSDWDLLGGYDEKMKAGLEDWDFWLRLLGESDIVISLESITFFYRIKEHSMVKELNADRARTQEVYNYLYQKHKEKINRVIGSPIQLMIDREEENEDIEQIRKGAKALGIIGRLMFGMLRKTGFLLLRKERR
jgi:glycosyltransferase involved in cell wall biosynthesis